MVEFIPPKRIRIYYSDNDFWSTFDAFGEVLLDINASEKRIELTKEYIKALWDKCSFGLYIAHQNRLLSEDTSTIVEYLQNLVKLEYIYINDKTHDTDCDNNENLIVDFVKDRTYTL